MIQQNAKEVISVKEENIIHEFPALPENEQFTTLLHAKAFAKL